MSGTILHSADTVLVVIDVQERLAAVMPRRDQVLGTVAFLCAVARVVGVDVAVTRQYPAGLGDVEPEIRAVLEQGASHGMRVSYSDKMAFDCFAEPSFCEALEATGCRQLLLVGMESHICVTQTALSAVDRGYDVHVCADGCCAREADAHALALERLRAADATVTVAESAAYELIGVAGTPEFRELLRLVKQRN